MNWKPNTILQDFGDEGYQIDISTRTYKNKTILIDRDVFDNITGRITANGEKYVIITIDGRKMYLSRYIMGMFASDKRRVIHKDSSIVDYRLDNLKAVAPKDVPRTTAKSVRQYYLKYIKDNMEKYMPPEEDDFGDDILKQVDSYFSRCDSI
jgi:hypothetical protein